MKRELLLFLLLIPFVLAEEITLTLNQREYYFLTGEEAVITIHSDSSYKDPINGMLSYTITQEINQGNFHYSSSNTKSTSFAIEPGKKDVALNFGSSDTPMTLNIGLRYSYNKDGAKEVSLENIKIHFVSEQSQKNNQQNQVSSSSTKSQTSKQYDPFAQQEQRMQQMINQIFGNQQSWQQPQNAQQRLQNNQMSQDSNALKQQIQNQLQQKQKMQEEFQRRLSQNPQFQKEHQDLLNKGYNLTGGSFNPETNNTGSFELNYQNQQGQQATLKGRMDNGKLSEIQKDTPQLREQMLKQLQQNKQFQKFQQELQNQGFKQKIIEYNKAQNITSLKLNYANEQNETAVIKAQITNNTVEKVELEHNLKKEESYLWTVLLLVMCVGGYLVYRKLSKKPEKTQNVELKVIEKPFDYVAQSRKLLQKAKQLFEKKEYKDAYGTAAQSLRLYLCYKNNLEKELTNDEVVNYLRKHNQSYKNVKECFDLCSLVEFAKVKANKKDFEKIVKTVEVILK